MTDNDSPNRVYRLVWNACTGVWQAVAETGRGRTRSTSAGRLSRRVQAAALATLAASGGAWAADPLPTGGHVVAGSGSITSGAGSLTVNQGSDRLAIDWNSFNIGAGNRVTFVQPSADSVALNRVTGSDPSLIQGELSSNGHVFLVNPNGVTFTSSARVDVGGLTASTLGLSNDDFMGGRYRFGAAGSGAAPVAGSAVVNQGRITTTAGGTVALIAARIVNDGTITARQGNVLMGAGSQVTLDLGGPVKIRVEKGALNALIRNGGAILADGGTVYLTARATGDLVSTVINQTGTIEARTLATGAQGRIVLLGDMQNGRVEVAGTLDASAPQGGNGGSIETSAASVKIAPDLRVTTAAASGGKTGNWLIDPFDITIAASGGDVTGATLSSALDSTNVTIDTTTNTYGGSAGAGTITVNDDIAKTGGANTTLRLLAHNDIDVNAGITSTGGHLNVELTADQDNSGAGSVHFGAGGHVVTNNGNFYVGSVAGSWDTVTATGQDFTMASGSYVDVGKGRLDIEVKHDITLADNSGQATPWSLRSTAATDYMFYDSGLTRWWSWDAGQPYGQVMMLGTTGGSITSANSDATHADIVTGTDVRLTATGSIGASGAPIRVSGMDDILGLVANPEWTSLTFPQVARAVRDEHRRQLVRRRGRHAGAVVGQRDARRPGQRDAADQPDG
jgi:filamentous hemagglutinin family protein